MNRSWSRAAVGVWISIATILICALAGRASADSGEFTGSIALLAHGPQGTNPLVLERSTETLAGSASLTIDLRGRVFGRLTIGTRAIDVTGTLRGKAPFPRLQLRTKKTSGPTYRGVLVGNEFVGRLVDRRRALAGTGTLRLDVEQSAPLKLDLLVALRNGWRAKRTGFGRLTVGESTLTVLASGIVSSVTTKLHAAGSGFLFDATGSGTTSFAISSFTCRAFGVRISGSAGTLDFRANPPDVTLVLTSGHPLGVASSAAPYLADPGDAGYALAQELVARRYTVEMYAFADHSDGTVYGPGQDDLVATLEDARDQYIVGRAFPTTVVVMAHSHGGVRAHQAIEDVPDLPVRLLIDLDTSSCSFKTGHLLEVIEDPVSAWLIGGQSYDDEDVVMPNVTFNLEVQSDTLCVVSFFDELYDDYENRRLDGSYTGLFFYDAGTSHSEVHDASGSTFPVVLNWVLSHL